MIKSAGIWNHFEEYMQILYRSTQDPSPLVKRYVCQAFNNVVELRPEVLIPVLESVVGFMLQVVGEEDEDASLEAADFFLVFCEQDVLHIHMEQYLGRVSF